VIDTSTGHLLRLVRHPRNDLQRRELTASSREAASPEASPYVFCVKKSFKRILLAEGETLSPKHRFPQNGDDYSHSQRSEADNYQEMAVTTWIRPELKSGGSVWIG